MDVFGGGKHYRNLQVLNTKHDDVETIMNKKGARVWMKHLLDSLEEQDFDKIDTRINGAILEFLEFSMKYYLSRYSRLKNEFEFKKHKIKNFTTINDV